MTSDLGRLSADNAALVGIMGELAVTASRTSASYEHEIDTLRSQLKEMAEALEPFANMTSGSCAYIYGAEMLKARSALSRYRGETPPPPTEKE